MVETSADAVIAVVIAVAIAAGAGAGAAGGDIVNVLEEEVVACLEPD